MNNTLSHGLERGDKVTINGEPWTVRDVQSATTMTLRKWRWYDRIWCLAVRAGRKIKKWLNTDISDRESKL